MRLIVRPPCKPHPAQDAVDEFDAVIAADPRVRLAEWRGPFLRAGYLSGAALFRYGGRLGLNAVPIAPSSWLGYLDRQYFAVLMGTPRFARCMPHFMLPARKGVYLFDAWPEFQERIVLFINKFSVDCVFISASQAAASIQERVEASVRWMPEGIEPAQYRQRPLPEKDIDVLQLGRRYDAYHERIVGDLSRSGRTYLYEREKGEMVFPAQREFAQGLARSKISICVPLSMTNPNRARGVETMTLRYLQSMVSRCLVVGHAPEEMVRLFGYNPVVEIDDADPAGQLADILANMDRYAGLIARNQRAVLENHTWRNRWHSMAEILFGACGFRPAPTYSPVPRPQAPRSSARDALRPPHLPPTPHDHEAPPSSETEGVA